MHVVNSPSRHPTLSIRRQPGTNPEVLWSSGARLGQAGPQEKPTALSCQISPKWNIADNGSNPGVDVTGHQGELTIEAIDLLANQEADQEAGQKAGQEPDQRRADQVAVRIKLPDGPGPQQLVVVFLRRPWSALPPMAELTDRLSSSGEIPEATLLVPYQGETLWTDTAGHKAPHWSDAHGSDAHWSDGPIALWDNKGKVIASIAAGFGGTLELRLDRPWTASKMTIKELEVDAKSARQCALNHLRTVVRPLVSDQGRIAISHGQGDLVDALLIVLIRQAFPKCAIEEQISTASATASATWKAFSKSVGMRLQTLQTLQRKSLSEDPAKLDALRAIIPEEWQTALIREINSVSRIFDIGDWAKHVRPTDQG